MDKLNKLDKLENEMKQLKNKCIDLSVKIGEIAPIGMKIEYKGIMYDIVKDVGQGYVRIVNTNHVFNFLAKDSGCTWDCENGAGETVEYTQPTREEYLEFANNSTEIVNTFLSKMDTNRISMALENINKQNTI